MEPDIIETTSAASEVEPVPEPEAAPSDSPAAEAPPAAESAASPEPEDVTHRLAADFIALTEEFPHILTPAQLPEGVLELAAGEGIPLLDAYLRHRWQEEKRVAAAQQKRQQSAQRSAGSLARGSAEAPPEQDAFLRAFRNAL